MESRTKTLEDTPSRIVVREYFMPWLWGGPTIIYMILAPVLWPVLRLVLGKKIIFDRAYQDVVIENRILFVDRKMQTHFSDINSIDLFQREIQVVVSAGRYVAAAPIRVEDLSLSLQDGTQVRIATAYRESTQLEVLGKRLGELMGKPFITSQDEVKDTEGAEAQGDTGGS